MEPKARAAARALELVRPGMRLGLGSGSTAELFIRGLGERVHEGLRVVGIPTSRATEALARSLGIPLALELDGPLHLAVDGADEIDPALNLIKGRGGALVREKIVARAAQRFIVIAEESKLAETLGRTPVPVEVMPFLRTATVARLAETGARPELRGGAIPYVTDNGNYIVDCAFAHPLADPVTLAARLDAIPGVVGHGLFLGMASAAVLGGETGVRVLGQLEG